MPKYKTVTELTELNVRLNKRAAELVALADNAKAEMAETREAVQKKYDSPEYADLPKSNRRQMAMYESRKAVAAIQKKYRDASRGGMRDIGAFAEEINAASDAYSPIKRLNIDTSQDPAQSEKRARYQQLMKSASVPDLMTMLDVFEATDDRAGLAAISSVVSGKSDRSYRKAIPNARVVRNVTWPDQGQLDAIFHSGRHMTDVVLEHDRGVARAANNHRSGVDRIRSGLRNSDKKRMEATPTHQPQ